ncbi:hypothetical protein [Shimia sp. FJ5]|uniref:hypothetical protein n=1 Tax=Shimia sp. FJ5 TaxID=3079054 RepID=UPI00293DF79B|nr:hypothetical protein [Shimia sp. FJ5]MDV4146651.1 hypothetical protein [Shimia sp. FJ5]
MQISEIYAQLTGNALSERDETRFTTMVAIEFLAKKEGVPVEALNLAAPDFAKTYPPDKDDLRGHWNGATHYKAWRRAILDAQMLADPCNTDGDPWTSLRRAARLCFNRTMASLHDLPRFLPSKTEPWHVDDEIIRNAYAPLRGAKRIRFRGALNAFRQLYDGDLVERTGLLPELMPAALPNLRDHRRFITMAPEIASARSMIKCKKSLNAFDYVHRLAAAGGLLDSVSDTLDDMRKAVVNLPDPSDVGIPPVKTKTLRVYINDVMHCIGGRDYRLTEVQQAWSDLRKMARSAGFQTNALFNISMPASAAGLMPSEISADWVQTVIEYHKSRGSRSTPTQCRLGCEQLDALRGVLPAELLPTVPIGIRRSFPAAKLPPRPKDPVVVAWDELYIKITKTALITDEYEHLWVIRREAIKKQTAPEDITQKWLEELRDSCPYDCLSHVYKGVHDLRKISGFEHLQPLWHRRQRHGGLPENLERELETVVATMGAAPTTYRSLKLAAGVLAEHLGFDENASLEDVRAVDIASFEWPCSAAKGKTYSKSIMQIKNYLTLPWTSEWRVLQEIVVGTGMTMKANPIPKLLAWSPDPSPRLVSLDWAQQLDRDLRSKIANPPHGRADLAKTMAKHVAEFDGLREIPEVDVSGLMPPPIGLIR